MATAFLPASIRSAIRTLYAFCRCTDDIVDRSAQSYFRGTLTQWRALSRRPWQEQVEPVLQAWCYTRQKYDVPQSHVDELIDGCEMDLRVTRYETWHQLRTYCYHVASTVGLISMHMIGHVAANASEIAEAREQAIDLGVALQLTNILRDVAEDFVRGRIYLPLEDMRRFGYSEYDLERQIVDERFCTLIDFEIERAWKLYESGLRGLKFLAPQGRMAVGMAAHLYRGILDQIQRQNYQIFKLRASMSTREKLLKVPGIYRQVRQLQ